MGIFQWARVAFSPLSCHNQFVKYYVAADVHGFYTLFREALENAGFFKETEPHKLIILGDLFDRGQEAKEMQEFILKLLDEEQVILVRGNHEDLFEEMVTIDEGFRFGIM